MDKKLRIYIDTSVLNFVFESDRLDSVITKKFFDLLISDPIYELCISDLVITEINKAYEIRKLQLLRLVERYELEILQLNQEAISLSTTYVENKIVPVKFIEDALHIAVATVFRCHFIVSWNYKHIVKASTIRKVHIMNQKLGYNLVEILTPREFIS